MLKVENNLIITARVRDKEKTNFLEYNQIYEKKFEVCKKGQFIKPNISTLAKNYDHFEITHIELKDLL